jgi:hypothetical protein
LHHLALAVTSDAIFDELVKRSFEAPDGSVKKFDIQGVVFLAGTWGYIWYAKCLSITYNEGDRTFYDAIIFHPWLLYLVMHDCSMNMICFSDRYCSFVDNLRYNTHGTLTF